MVGAILLFLVIAILSVLNVEPVPVNFGFVEVEWPLIIIIFASVLLGALIATLLSTYRAFKDQRKNKHKTSAKQFSSDQKPTDSTIKTANDTKSPLDNDNEINTESNNDINSDNKL